MTDRFADKNAIITGAAGGIGFQTSRMFGLEGARVGIMDINGEAANAATEKLKEENVEAAAFQLGRDG